VRRDQSARHGSTESSGADTVKDGIGGNTYNGDSFMDPMRDRSVHLFLSKLLCPIECIRCVPDFNVQRVVLSNRARQITIRLASALERSKNAHQQLLR
jgi:hypothetical protein